MTQSPGFQRSSEKPGGIGAEKGAVLVVDDEAVIRSLTQRMLKDGGYSTFEAADGAEALASVLAGLPVHLVLTDIVMPQLDGVQLLDALSGSRPDLPVLLMSGHSTADLAERGIASPCGILMKPFNQDRLLNEVRRCIDEWTPRAAK
jgi:two-component system cell cycle sensor histidine kinase/response regulator CckA